MIFFVPLNFFFFFFKKHSRLKEYCTLNVSPTEDLVVFCSPGIQEMLETQRLTFDRVFLIKHTKHEVTEA